MAEAPHPLKTWNDLETRSRARHERLPPLRRRPAFCSGRNFALLQIRTVLAMLCRNFDVALADPKRPVEERLAFTMMPTGMMVRMRRR